MQSTSNPKRANTSKKKQGGRNNNKPTTPDTALQTLKQFNADIAPCLEAAAKLSRSKARVQRKDLNFKALGLLIKFKAQLIPKQLALYNEKISTELLSTHNEKEKLIAIISEITKKHCALSEKITSATEAKIEIQREMKTYVGYLVELIIYFHQIDDSLGFDLLFTGIFIQRIFNRLAPPINEAEKTKQGVINLIPLRVQADILTSKTDQYFRGLIETTPHKIAKHQETLASLDARLSHIAMQDKIKLSSLTRIRIMRQRAHIAILKSLAKEDNNAAHAFDIEESAHALMKQLSQVNHKSKSEALREIIPHLETIAELLVKHKNNPERALYWINQCIDLLQKNKNNLLDPISIILLPFDGYMTRIETLRKNILTTLPHQNDKPQQEILNAAPEADKSTNKQITAQKKSLRQYENVIQKWLVIITMIGKDDEKIPGKIAALHESLLAFKDTGHLRLEFSLMQQVAKNHMMLHDKTSQSLSINQLNQLLVLEQGAPKQIRKILRAILILQLEKLFAAAFFARDNILALLKKEDYLSAKNYLDCIIPLLTSYIKNLNNLGNTDEKTKLILADTIVLIDSYQIIQEQLAGFIAAKEEREKRLKIKETLLGFINYFDFDIHSENKSSYILTFKDSHAKKIFMEVLLGDVSKHKLTFLEVDELQLQILNFREIPLEHIKQVLNYFTRQLNTKETSQVSDYSFGESNATNVDIHKSNNAKASAQRRKARKRVERLAKKADEEKRLIAKAKQDELVAPQQYEVEAQEAQSEFSSRVEVIEIPTASIAKTEIVIDARLLDPHLDDRRGGEALVKPAPDVSTSSSKVENVNLCAQLQIEKTSTQTNLALRINLLEQILKENGESSVKIAAMLLHLTKIVCIYVGPYHHEVLKALRLSLVHPDFTDANWLSQASMVEKFIKHFIKTRDIAESIEESLLIAIDNTANVRNTLKIEENNSQSPKFFKDNGINSAKKITLKDFNDVAYLEKSLSDSLLKIKEYSEFLNSSDQTENKKYLYAIQYLLICIVESFNQLPQYKDSVNMEEMQKIRNILSHDDTRELTAEAVKTIMNSNVILQLESIFLTRRNASSPTHSRVIKN